MLLGAFLTVKEVGEKQKQFECIRDFLFLSKYLNASLCNAAFCTLGLWTVQHYGKCRNQHFWSCPKQMCKSQGCLGHSRFHLFVMCLMRIPQPYSNLVLNCCNCPLIYCNNQIRSHLTGSPLPFPGVKEKQLNMCSGRDHAEYIENVTIHLK